MTKIMHFIVMFWNFKFQSCCSVYLKLKSSVFFIILTLQMYSNESPLCNRYSFLVTKHLKMQMGETKLGSRRLYLYLQSSSLLKIAFLSTLMFVMFLCKTFRFSLQGSSKCTAH